MSALTSWSTITRVGAVAVLTGRCMASITSAVIRTLSGSARRAFEACARNLAADQSTDSLKCVSALRKEKALQEQWIWEMVSQHELIPNDAYTRISFLAVLARIG